MITNHFKVDSEKSISDMVATLNTGDIFITTSRKTSSLHSFVIQTCCNSPWTHAGIIVVLPNSTTKYLFESVNQHKTELVYDNPITKKKAVGNGVHLIPLESFLKDGLQNLKRNGDPSSYVNIGILKVAPSSSYVNFANKLITFVSTPQIYSIKYPASNWPLIKSWWDGFYSLFTCCGCFTTLEIDEMNYNGKTLIYPHHDEINTHKEIFCSELVISSLKFTTFFTSNIPCEEWTVADISLPSNLNKYLHGISYENRVNIYNFSA